MTSGSKKLTVVVISMGRPDCLHDIALTLNSQTRKPDHILFVVTDPADVPADLRGGPTPDLSIVPQIIVTEKGTCHQRNIGIESLTHDTGYIVFFDDDYVPVPNALEAIETAFDVFGPDVGGMSGHLIADGIAGPGITLDEAKTLIATQQQADPGDRFSARHFRIIKDTIGLYGCNMAFRVEAIGDIRFDEKLPLYAWQEDVDFAHRVARAAGKRMVLTNAFSGVHRGVKNGRERRGARLGYSQIANNWYLWRNSQLPGRFAFRVALRNVLANHARLLRSEPWIDRRGRAQGNRRALVDILLRRVDPQRVLDI